VDQGLEFLKANACVGQ